MRVKDIRELVEACAKARIKDLLGRCRDNF